MHTQKIYGTNCPFLHLLHKLTNMIGFMQIEECISSGFFLDWKMP